MPHDRTRNPILLAIAAAALLATSACRSSDGLGPGSVLGAGDVWIASAENSLFAYSADQLTRDTAQTPAITIGAPSTQFLGVAFDANGNLWATQFTGNGIVEYSGKELSSSGVPDPAISIGGTGLSLESPAALAFDARGDLWVSNSGFDGNTIVEFTPDQLAASGAPVPAVTLGTLSGPLIAPFGIAFDNRGNLWVATDNASVVEFSAAQLAETGSPDPAVAVSLLGACNVPQGIAFDAKGDLWIACTGPGQLVELGVGQLGVSGAPTPQAVVTLNGNSAFDPGGLAFDKSGNLWITNLVAEQLIKLTPEQLASSGALTPTFTLMSVRAPVGIAIGPHAMGIPLQP